MAQTLRANLRGSVGGQLGQQQHGRRRHDEYVSKRREFQEVAVPGNDPVGLSIDSEFEELVISRFAARPYDRGHHDGFRDPREQFKELAAIFAADVPVEFWPCESRSEFAQSLFGDQGLRLIDEHANGTTGNRTGQQQATNQYIRIENNSTVTHPCRAVP